MDFDEEAVPFAFTPSSSSSSSCSPPSALSVGSEGAAESGNQEANIASGVHAPWVAPRIISHSAGDLDILRRSIICFFADDKFIEMAVVAVTTLLKCTPGVSVGVLAPSNRIAEMITQQVPAEDLDRVQIRVASAKPFFHDWNPTQFKLDIVQFCDTKRFDYVYWMDSDTLTYEDISEKLIEFVQSPCHFLMTPDHVNYDQKFCELWLQQHGEEAPVIPQSCFMGFKVDVLEPFFQEWRKEWSAWITPYAFARYPDPRPHFIGSAFCAEQYALGVALARYCKQHVMEYENPIMWFTRQSVAIPRLPGDAKPCYEDVNDVVSPKTPPFDGVDDGKTGKVARATKNEGMDGTDISSVFVGGESKTVSKDDRRSVFKKLIRRRSGGSNSSYSFEVTPPKPYQRQQTRVSCAPSCYNGSLLRTWVSYPVESESGTSPSSLSSTSQTSASEDGTSGSSPSLDDVRIQRNAGGQTTSDDRYSVKLLSSSVGAPTYVVVSVPGGADYNVSQCFPFVPYSMVSFSISSLSQFGNSGCFCHNKLLMSQVPALILADGRTELRNGDATDGGRSAIIDKFFGFFHYYHQNQRSMLSWWRETSRCRQFVLCPCAQPQKVQRVKRVKPSKKQQQTTTQFPID